MAALRRYSLAQSVCSGTLDEPEARRRWIDFEFARAQEVRQQQARRAAAAPVICQTFGTITTCN